MSPIHRRGPLAATLAACLALAAAAFPARAAAPVPVPAAAAPDVDPAVLARLRDAAMASDWGYQRLADLTDLVGPRLSGSPGLEAGIQQVAAAMRALGAQVQLQPAKVPHWVRGLEQGEIVDYAGRPAGLTQRLALTALGSSSATPAAGLTARVLVVHDFDELKAQAAEVPGSIVLFEHIFDQRQALNGHAGVAYGQATAYRSYGPGEAAKLGAVAALVRTAGGGEYRMPHTGLTVFPKGVAPIPAAALAAEDADRIVRLAARGPVTVHLLLTPQTLPDVDSFNVIADWPGREKPDEVVIVSGHLDSWDLATGAIDDGAGVMASAGVIEVLRELQLHARRTIRFIAWTNEENGGRGGAAYFASVKDKLPTQVAAIESDEGGGRSLGIIAAVKHASLPALQPIIDALRPIGATARERSDNGVGSDIGPLQAAGVPGFAPLVDARHYFDYHHSPADTLDKVEPENLRTQTATMAVLAFYLAERAEPLPRFKAQDEE
jgi:carboxypeptidase Q